MQAAEGTTEGTKAGRRSDNKAIHKCIMPSQKLALCRPESRLHLVHRKVEMAVGKLWYPVVVFMSGLGTGVLWSCLQHSHTSDERADSSVPLEDREFAAQMKQLFGGGQLREFAEQFDKMTIRIRKTPIDAWASPDGRFIIRLFGSDETIASDLCYPVGAAKELNRHYAFSCDGRTYSCALARSMDGSTMSQVQFHYTDVNARDLTYVDSDADGYWDTLFDRSREPARVYERDGLCWKERTKGVSKEPRRKTGDH